jgi:hypothetical protein
VSGFRYVLELPNGEPADPAFFNTALPPGMWKPGDTFMAASDLRQFRIVEIAELENRDIEFVNASGSSGGSTTRRRVSVPWPPNLVRAVTSVRRVRLFLDYRCGLLARNATGEG